MPRLFLRLLGVAALLFAAAHPAAAAGPAVHELLLRYSFNGTGDAALVTGGTVTMAPGAVFVAVNADVSNRNEPAVFFPQVIDLDPHAGVRSYGVVGQHSLCAAPLTCSLDGKTFRFGVADTVQGDGKRHSHLRFYIAIRGANINLQDTVVVGWHERRSTTGLRIRDNNAVQGAGVEADGLSVGVTTRATAPGPPGGSIAIATSGCDVVGAGVLVLSGGVRSEHVICPSGPVGTIAWTKTSWVINGAIGGASEAHSRLIVMPQ